MFGHRFERVFHIALPLGPAQVRCQNHARALVNRELNRRDGRPDSRVVGDLAVFERNVEINTDENPLPRQVEVAYGKLRHTSSFLRLFEQMTHLSGRDDWSEIVAEVTTTFWDEQNKRTERGVRQILRRGGNAPGYASL